MASEWWTEVVWKPDGSWRVALPFQQQNSLPQDFAKICAIDLVDVQEKREFWLCLCIRNGLHEEAGCWPELKSQSIRSLDGSEASNKVLVAGVGVELNCLTSVLVVFMQQL